LKDFSEESLGCFAVATSLHQNIQDVAILVYRAPKIEMFAVNPNKDFIAKPPIRSFGFAPFQCPLIRWPKLQAPAPNGFVRDGYASLRH